MLYPNLKNIKTLVLTLLHETDEAQKSSQARTVKKNMILRISLFAVFLCFEELGVRKKKIISLKLLYSRRRALQC